MFNSSRKTSEHFFGRVEEKKVAPKVNSYRKDTKPKVLPKSSFFSKASRFVKSAYEKADKANTFLEKQRNKSIKRNKTKERYIRSKNRLQKIQRRNRPTFTL